MSYFVEDQILVAGSQQTVTNNPWLEGIKRPQDSVGSIFASTESQGFIPTAPISNPDKVPVYTGTPIIEQGQHHDFHFRVYIIPSDLSFTNPAVETDLGFNIWNTHRSEVTLQSIFVDGSDDITFSLSTGDSLRDSLYEEVYLQFGGNEATIDAEVTFGWDVDPDSVFKVLAIVSSAFNIVPDVPVNETWSYLTDIITAHDGSEQRVALRSSPRSTINFKVDIIDLKQRRDQYNILYSATGRRAVIPLYHHGVKLTGDSAIATSRLYFNPNKTQMVEGETLVIINPTTEESVISAVSTMYSDGCELTSLLGQDITSHWYVYPANSVYLDENVGISMNSVTGELPLKAQSALPITVTRTGSSAVIPTFNDINVMNLRPLIPATELFDLRKELLDNDVSIPKLMYYDDPHPTVKGTRKWRIDRYNEVDEDFFRKFYSDVKGAQKAFYMSTWLPDMELASGFVPSESGGSLIIKGSNYFQNYFPFETWKCIHIQYESTTLEDSYHRVTSANVEADGTTTLLIDPILADDAEVANIKTISYLMKVRGDDTLNRQHGHRTSIYSWNFVTVDQ